MYKNIYEFLTENKMLPEEYDFKYQFDCGYYKRVNYFKKYDIFDSNNLARLFNYKNTPGSVRFDCDGSGEGNIEGLSSLTREIYRALWHWNDIIDSKDVLRYASCAFGSLKMGPDTMNTIATSIITEIRTNDVLKKGSNIWKEYCHDEYPGEDTSRYHVSNKYILWLLDNKREVFMDALRDYEPAADYVSHIGNFVLVPAYFNPYRGANNKICDFWDRSLRVLSKPCFSGELVYNNRGKKHFIEWNANQFTKYINFFFLWEYWKNGRIRSISNDITNTYHDLKEIELLIRKRGIFMVAMLRIAFFDIPQRYIAKNGDEKWKDWKVSYLYKTIVDQVFLRAECFDGYNDVLNEIIKLIENNKSLERKSEVRQIIDEAKNRIKELDESKKGN